MTPSTIAIVGLALLFLIPLALVVFGRTGHKPVEKLSGPMGRAPASYFKAQPQPESKFEQSCRESDEQRERDYRQFYGMVTMSEAEYNRKVAEREASQTIFERMKG